MVSTSNQHTLKQAFRSRSGLPEDEPHGRDLRAVRIQVGWPKGARSLGSWDARYVEWINASSANIIFKSPEGAQKALTSPTHPTSCA